MLAIVINLVSKDRLQPGRPCGTLFPPYQIYKHLKLNRGCESNRDLPDLGLTQSKSLEIPRVGYGLVAEAARLIYIPTT